MIINFNNLQDTLPKPAGEATQSGKSKGVSDAQAQTAQGGTPSDSVNLTDSGRLMQKLDQILKAVPVVNADRVSKIQQDLHQGAYAIRPDVIGMKLSQMENFLQANL